MSHYNRSTISDGPLSSSQSFAGKARQNKARSVDLLVVVSAELLLLFKSPSSQWLANISVWIFTTNHETDLARWISGNSGVGILDGGEDFFARFLK
jgi:hypothetical protein